LITRHLRFFFFQAEDGIRDRNVTGVQTCALPICLGHGLSMAVGMALGARQRKMPWKTVCLMGDGECCEGSVWEAAMSAPHFKLEIGRASCREEGRGWWRLDR